MTSPRHVRHLVSAAVLSFALFTIGLWQPVLASESSGRTAAGATTPLSSSADYSTALQALIDGASPGGEVVVPASDTEYMITRGIQVSKPLTITLDGATLRQMTVQQDAFDVTASDVHIIGGTIVGPSNGVFRAGESAIEIRGSSADSPLEDVSVVGTSIQNWGFQAVIASFVHGLTVESCAIRGVGYAGIGGTSVIGALVVGNNIADIGPGSGGDAYGIYASRASEMDLSTYPVSSDWKIGGNRVNGPSFWEALDTHGGKRILFKNNRVVDAFYGIAAGGSVADGSYVVPPTHIVIDGNVLDATGLASVTGMGISLRGDGTSSAVAGYATGSITNNTVTGYSPPTNWQSYGAIQIKLTDGVLVGNNTIVNAGVHGIFVNYRNRRFLVVANTVIHPYSNQVPEGAYGSSISAGIHVLGPFSSGCIMGNTIKRWHSSDRPAWTYSIFVDGNTQNRVGMRSNRGSAPVINHSRKDVMCGRTRNR